MGILLNNNSHPYIDKGESEKHIKEKVAKADIDLTKIKCTSLAMDLLRKLLNPNPTTRIKASDAILHPWLKPNIEDVLQRDLKSSSVGRNSAIYSGLVGSSMTASTQTTLPASLEVDGSTNKKGNNLYLRIRDRQRSFDPKAQQTSKHEVTKQPELANSSRGSGVNPVKVALKGLLLMAFMHQQIEGPAAKPISLKLRMISKYKKQPRSPLKPAKMDRTDEQSVKLTTGTNGQTYSNVLCSPLMTQLTLDPLPAKSRISSKQNIANDSFERNGDRWQENSLEVVDIPAEEIGFTRFDLRDCEEELNKEHSTQKQFTISRKNSPSKPYSNTSNQMITTQHGMVIRKNLGPHPSHLGIGVRKESLLSRGQDTSGNNRLESLQTSLERKYLLAKDGGPNPKQYRVFGKEPGSQPKHWTTTKLGDPSSQSTEASPVLMSKPRVASTDLDRAKIKMRMPYQSDLRGYNQLVATMNSSPTESNRFSPDLKQDLSGNRVFNTENQLGSRQNETSSANQSLLQSVSPQAPRALKPIKRVELGNSRRDEGVFRLNRETGTKPAAAKPRPQEAFMQKLQSLHTSIEDSKRMEDRRKSHYPAQSKGSAYDSPIVRSGMNSSLYSRSQNRHPNLSVSTYVATKNT